MKLFSARLDSLLHGGLMPLLLLHCYIYLYLFTCLFLCHDHNRLWFIDRFFSRVPPYSSAFCDYLFWPWVLLTMCLILIFFPNDLSMKIIYEAFVTFLRMCSLVCIRETLSWTQARTHYLCTHADIHTDMYTHMDTSTKIFSVFWLCDKQHFSLTDTA